MATSPKSWDVKQEQNELNYELDFTVGILHSPQHCAGPIIVGISDTTGSTHMSPDNYLF